MIKKNVLGMVLYFQQRASTSSYSIFWDESHGYHGMFLNSRSQERRGEALREVQTQSQALWRRYHESSHLTDKQSICCSSRTDLHCKRNCKTTENRKTFFEYKNFCASHVRTDYINYVND